MEIIRSIKYLGEDVKSAKTTAYDLGAAVKSFKQGNLEKPLMDAA